MDHPRRPRHVHLKVLSNGVLLGGVSTSQLAVGQSRNVTRAWLRDTVWMILGESSSRKIAHRDVRINLVKFQRLDDFPMRFPAVLRGSFQRLDPSPNVSLIVLIDFRELWEQQHTVRESEAMRCAGLSGLHGIHGILEDHMGQVVKKHGPGPPKKNGKSQGILVKQ